MFFALFCVIGLSLYADEKPISVDKLPSAAVKFVKTNFTKATITLATIEKGWFSSDYEVFLDDSTSIEFDSVGQWREIQNSINGVSLKFLPKNTQNFIETRYFGVKVKSIELKRKVIEVELMNDLEITFDKGTGSLLSVEQ